MITFVQDVLHRSRPMRPATTGVYRQLTKGCAPKLIDGLPVNR